MRLGRQWPGEAIRPSRWWLVLDFVRLALVAVVVLASAVYLAAWPIWSRLPALGRVVGGVRPGWLVGVVSVVVVSVTVGGPLRRWRERAARNAELPVSWSPDDARRLL